MTYEYQCVSESCAFVAEKVRPISAAHVPEIECPVCGGRSEFKYSPSAVLTQGMDKKTFDVAVGQDAARRWKAIHEQQEIRDKTRRESGKLGLEGITPTEYRPASDGGQKRRAGILE